MLHNALYRSHSLQNLPLACQRECALQNCIFLNGFLMLMLSLMKFGCKVYIYINKPFYYYLFIYLFYYCHCIMDSLFEST